MGTETSRDDTTSQTNFAALCGVSAEAVRKACIAGKIDIVGEGRSKKILLSGKNSISYLHDKNSQRIKNTVPKLNDEAENRSVIHPSNSVENTEPSTKKPSSNIQSLIDFESEDIEFGDITLNDINKFKSLEAAKKSAQSRKIERGKLIDRQLVTTVFGKIYTIEVNELKPISDKTPSKIAAIFEDEDSEKILKVSQLLSSEITKVLKHINYEVDRFLKDINTDTTDIYADS